jgi:hypothetical protein
MQNKYKWHDTKKMAVFWVVATHRPDDGGSTDLWNFRKLIPVYLALQPRKQPSSYISPWEHQVKQDTKLGNAYNYDDNI